MAMPSVSIVIVIIVMFVTSITKRLFAKTIFLLHASILVRNSAARDRQLTRRTLLRPSMVDLPDQVPRRISQSAAVQLADAVTPVQRS
jgi:hypothetical protein